MDSSKIILVPLDFEAASLAALRLALEQARATDHRVVLLHVYSMPPNKFADLDPDLRAHMHQQAASKALRPLNDLAARWKVECLLREGDPVEGILNVSEEVGACRVIMGTHGRRHLDRWLIGSVAEGVIRRSKVPVMTIREAETSEPRPTSRTDAKVILCAVDLEPSAASVVRVASAFARELGAPLELAHVCAMPFYVLPGFDPVLAKDLDMELSRDANKALDVLAREFGAERWHVESGDPGKQILALMERVQPAALVLGTHGRRGLARLSLGSVAEWLLRRSPVPVLVSHLGGTVIEGADGQPANAAFEA